jgi:hypothetical protein
MHRLTNKKAAVFNLPQVTADAIEGMAKRGVITPTLAKAAKPFGPQSVAPGESITLTDEQAEILALGYASTAIYLEAGSIELEEVAA